MWHGLMCLIRKVIFTHVKPEMIERIGFQVNFCMVRAKYGAAEVQCPFWKGGLSTDWVPGEGSAAGDELFLGGGGRTDFESQRQREEEEGMKA